MYQFMFESSMLVATRTMYGDEQTAEWLFRQDYDPGFVSRHPNQLSTLYRKKMESVAEKA